MKRPRKRIHTFVYYFHRQLYMCRNEMSIGNIDGDIMLKKYDKIYRITDMNELLDLFSGNYPEDNEAHHLIDYGWEMGKSLLGLILINSKMREAKKYWSEYTEELDDIKEEHLHDFYYEGAIVCLIKWEHILVENELEGILTDDQFFVWYLRDYFNLSYSHISILREHFESSGNESTIRDLYMKARGKMKKMLELCNKYSTYVKGGN